MIDLEHLRAFIAIAEVGGVTRAADRLHLSQPAVSQRISGLEVSLGVQLFERVGRGLRLTTDGEDLLRRSRRVLDEANGLTERARALKSGDAGMLKIGATPPMIEGILLSFLPGWRRRHPAIEVRIVEDGGQSLATRLERGEVQLAYVPAVSDRFAGRLLFPIHVVAAVPIASRLARLRLVEVEDLASEPLLALNRGFGSREWFETACQLVNASPNFVLESGSHTVVLGLARAGYGIGILPSAVNVANGDVRLVPIVVRGVPIGKWTMLAWQPNKYQASYIATFAEELAAYAERNFPGRSLVRRAPAIRRPRIGL
jgi:LysR family transcriptional regulator, cyn operon transcriptional activator